MDYCEMPHKFILVGPSGSGKSTMASVLANSFGLKRCITTTTRPPRFYEVDGQDYYFVSSMEGLDLFEQAVFGGYKYGITKDELARGDFLILDPQGVNFYRQHYPGPTTVIRLQRNGINVDEARRARDIGAGFDDVNADFVVCGDTIPEMSKNLCAVIEALPVCQLWHKPAQRPSLDNMIDSAAAELKLDKKGPDSFLVEHFNLLEER